MCGIAGVIDFKNEVKTGTWVGEMMNTMQRRGPDAVGIDFSDSGVLLHSRLAVIDPVQGGQPMKLARNGEIYTLVYNGELYNTEELRRTLEMSGEHFISHSDTEVLLKAYVHWGEKCPERLNGIFAFAVLHQKEKKLFLARDRMGVKPLFYSLCDSTCIFASEIKTILKHPAVEPVIDEWGIAELLLIGPGRTPGYGVFRDIRELRPGEAAVFTDHGLKKKRWWQLTDHAHTDTPEETIEKVRFLVTDAIHRQLISDVPIGTFLSGGLDSSLISAVASAKLKEQGQQLKTFSVTYRDNRKYFQTSRFQPTTDDDFIETMAHAIDSEHHTVILDQEQLADALTTATEARDLPGMADVDSSLLLFCGEIRKHVKVALSGECADELFGGYPWYRSEALLQTPNFPWARSTRMRAGFLAPSLARKMPVLQPCFGTASDAEDGMDFALLSESIQKEGNDYVRKACRKTLLETHANAAASPEEKHLRQMIRLNTDWFMQTLLDRKDRMSMYHGLEVRVPFCDHRLAEYLYSVPGDMKQTGGMEKGLLREAAAGLLPEEIRLRRKSPYPKTHHPEYRNLVRGMLRDILHDRDAPLFTIIRKDALLRLLGDEFTEPWYGQLMTGPQTMAYMIQLNHWLAHYRVRISL